MARTPFSPPRVDGGATETAFPARHDRAVEFVPLLLGGSAANDAPAVDADLAQRTQAFEDAAHQGYQEGLVLGRNQALAELGQLVEGWRTSVAELGTLRAQLIEAYRRELIELALGVAEAWVQGRLSDRVSQLEPLIDQAVAALGRDEALRVIAAPEDAKELEGWLAGQPGGGTGITLETSARLRRGDLRVSSAAGSVETLAAERIARVRALVLGEVHDEATEDEP